MAAALGLLSGVGLGALKGYAAEKLQQKHEGDAAWHDFMTNSIMQHPEVAGTPEGQKAIAQIYGKEHAPLVQGFLQMAATAKQKAAQDYQQNVIGGGAAPTAGGPPAASGQPDTPESLRSLAQRAEAHLADPQYANIYTKEQLAAGTAHIKDLRDRADKLEQNAFREQQHQETMGQQKQFHEETEADRAATRALMAQGKAESNQFKQFQEQHMAEEDADKRQKLADDQQKLLDSNRDKLLSDFEKLPDSAKPNAESRVTGYNAMASQFYRKHSDAGAPTLLKFTAAKKGSFGPLNVGGVAPTIEAVPPQYGTNKKTGQTGWVDADGNFYAESSPSGSSDAGR